MLVVAEKKAAPGVTCQGSTSAATGGMASGGSVDAGAAGAAMASGDDVTVLMRNLNLTQQEATPFLLDDEGDDDPVGPEWALIGKVLAPNTLHVNTFKAILRPAWGNPKGLEFRPMGTNMFLAEFGSEADRSRVAKGGPWNVSRHVVLLKEFDPRIKPVDVVFNELPVWARIMNLGYELMNSERGIPLASRLGKVEKADVDENGRAWGSYLRVRVTIDASEPVMRYVSVHSRKKNQTVHYEVMHERLPIFCFSCGRFGHSSLACPTPAERDAEGRLPYDGSRLCVPDRKKKVLGGSSDFSQSSKGSWSGTERASGSDSTTEDRKKKGNEQGEVPSPVKKTPRARKIGTVSKGQRSYAGDVPDSTNTPGQPRVSGQKRKQTKQVYVVKAHDVTASVTANQGSLALAVVDTTPGVENETMEDDQHKKQRTDTTRSADQAVAAMQHRQAQ